jgi:sugar phosphate isomerase/epimerase
MEKTLSRRSFLGVSLAAAAASLAAKPSDAGPYRIALETYTFHDIDLAGTLARTRDLGVRYLELHDGHLPRDASPADLSRAQKALSDAGITATGVYIHDAFTESEADARPIFDYAKTMGFTYINGGPKREALPLLDRLVPEYGIRIAVHNHGPKARYETLEDVTSMLDKYPNISACIDIGHFARSKVDPVHATRVLATRAVAIHVKDVTPAGENAVLGEGTIDLQGVFKALRESGFSGLVVLEYEGDFDNMDRRLAGMRRSLVLLEQLIGRR